MRIMRKLFLATSAVLAIAVLAGCRGKPQPDLYHPGEMEVWRTSERDVLDVPATALPRVELVTNMGRIILELYEDQAPLSVANFLEYVNAGFYDDTLIHRVEPGFVIQGGGFTPEMERKVTGASIPNEAGNRLRNVRGSVGAARTMEMDSATSQFYINLADNPGLNGDGVNSGYAVFGRVYEGMSIVDAIGLVETQSQGGMSSVPVEPVIIETARQIQ